MFPVMCNKEMYIEYRCNVIFVVMSLRHCQLSSHYHYKNHITSVFYIHFFITHHREHLEITLKYKNMKLMYYCSYDTIKTLK